MSRLDTRRGAAILALLSIATLAAPGAIAQNRGLRQGAAVPPAEARIDAALAVGTVKVRVARGSDEAVAGTDVTLVGETGQRVARTDSSGATTFTGLEPEARYVVSARVDDRSLVSSPFDVPAKGGVDVVLATEPAAVAARGGRPDPRQMSGIARPQPDDPAGQLTVRPAQGDLRQTPFGGLEADVPVGATVHLVGYAADGTVTIDSRKIEAKDAGRLRFDGLDRSGNVAYYVLSVFAREGGADRLMSQAVQMMPQVGSRLMLAGNAVDSAAAPIDDLSRHFGAGSIVPDPGEVSVRIFTADGKSELAKKITEVELVPISGGGEPRTAEAGTRTAGPDEVVARSVPIRALPRTEPGQASFLVVRPSLDMPIDGAELSLRRADAAADAPALGTRRTSVEGTAIFAELEPGVEYIATARVHGKSIDSEAFTVTAEAATSFAFAFEWPREDLVEASFSGVPAGADHVYYARAKLGDRELSSPPFQLTEGLGAAVPIFLYEDLLFRVHGGGQLDDTKMWFQLQMSVANPSITPFDGAGEPISLPLPKGFIAASVAEEMATRVKVESDVGFVWRGAVPPGQRDFIATFALPVVDGKVTFDMPLPYGMTGGRIMVEDLPGIDLEIPAGIQAAPVDRGDGRRFIELTEISREPGERLVFSVSGLPQHKAWKRWVRRGVGGVVVVLLGWAMWAVFSTRRETGAQAMRRALERERDRLLDELAILEADKSSDRVAKKTYADRRKKLMTRLEELYAELGGDSPDRARPAG